MSTYANRRAQGLCGWPGCKHVSLGKAYCPLHRAYFSEQSKAKYRAARAAGRCFACGDSTLSSMCDECLKLYKTARKRPKEVGLDVVELEARAAAGLCVDCGKREATRGVIRCDECHASWVQTFPAKRARKQVDGSARKKAWRDKRLLSGKCIECGNATQGEYRCLKCRLRISEKRRTLPRVKETRCSCCRQVGHNIRLCQSSAARKEARS